MPDTLTETVGSKIAPSLYPATGDVIPDAVEHLLEAIAIWRGDTPLNGDSIDSLMIYIRSQIDGHEEEVDVDCSDGE